MGTTTKSFWLNFLDNEIPKINEAKADFICLNVAYLAYITSPELAMSQFHAVK